MRKVLGAFAIFCLSSIANAAVIPVGVHNDVSVNTVLNDWGWEVVYWDSYAAGNFNNSLSINSVLNGLGTGDYVMLAGIQSGASTFDVLSAALFEEITTVTALNQTNTANGAEWYFNSLSMGFAGLGSTIMQTSADTNGLNERERLSWHTSADAGRAGNIAPDYVWGGWRSGNNYGLNTSTNWEKVVLKYVGPSASVPEPAPLALIMIGLAAIGFSRRKKSIN